MHALFLILTVFLFEGEMNSELLFFGTFPSFDFSVLAAFDRLSPRIRIVGCFCTYLVYERESNADFRAFFPLLVAPSRRPLSSSDSR